MFLYEGNKINFDLNFKEQANDIDRSNHEMKILVNKNENNSNIKNNIIISNAIKSNFNSENVNCLKKCLLVNIESVYFSRILFSHLDEKIKLKVIKYNKKLQKNLDIKLINYKFYTGKYIIYENNIKGKEYDEYNNDNFLFLGEYLNGKGKEYNKYGFLEFEGEYLNGKKHGKGK